MIDGRPLSCHGVMLASTLGYYEAPLACLPLRQPFNKCGRIKRSIEFIFEVLQLFLQESKSKNVTMIYRSQQSSSTIGRIILAGPLPLPLPIHPLGVVVWPRGSLNNITK